ncbi:hypothetical protein CAC42_184 [Sphaceloma murrayae]|uniref:Uncharacterized protein n=1 Tax=Sphaceloma murrayae TaxID=2082308 RepID=A0A2K1QNK9_9PEZI|nr:hypothetical protein CAC42_184 [Sphaceloma murrayae]
MAGETPDARVSRLAEGFNSLMDEYNQLLAKSRAFERNLQEAKAQFERFVTERGSITREDVGDFEFAAPTRDIEDPLRRQVSKDKWWMRNDLPMIKRNLLRTRYAVDSVQQLGLDRASADEAGSKISSEVIVNGSSAMPSISESPLEQDFTVPGTPSRLDCPFASMANRRLSAHAKSVVSRYRPNGTLASRSSGSQAIARMAMPQPTHSAAPDSPKEQCGALRSPRKSGNEIEASIQGSGPVCPIRFLEKSSPEDVAEYFENHKHEIPRSHEVCVKRYQSNEQSIRQLDAKYGNLVSMIQGLGQKHAPMLPEKNEEGEAEGQDAESAERVRKWASDISNVKVRDEPEEESAEHEQEEERKPHFDRPMKDVRVGESPSRPWGIPVPVEVVERTETRERDRERKRVGSARGSGGGGGGGGVGTEETPAKCPFGHGGPGAVNPHVQAEASKPDKEGHAPGPTPVFLPTLVDTSKQQHSGTMTFTGPVFIGYSPEQAVAVLRTLKGG